MTKPGVPHLLAIGLLVQIPAVSAQALAANDRESVQILEAALASLSGTNLSSAGKQVVIARHGRYAVVSLIPHSKQRRGGSVHIVVDPRSREVVYTLGEE